MSTLAVNYNFPKSSNRQFIGVTIKQFQLLSHSLAMPILLLVTSLLLSTLLGWLHQFYVSNYIPPTPPDQSNPVQIPISSRQQILNYNNYIQYFNQDTNESYDFGICNMYNKSCSGYLKPFQQEWTGTDAGQLRFQQTQPDNLDPNINTSTLLYFPSFTQSNDTFILQPNDFAEYQDSLTYQLMNQSIEASHQQVSPDNVYNKSSQFSYDQRTKLFNSGLFYSNFSSSGNVYQNLTFLGYSSHQNPINFARTNFQFIVSQQYEMFQNFIRNVFKQVNGQPIQIFGYYKQLWNTLTDYGKDSATPIFECFFVPLICYIVLIYMCYQTSQENGDGSVAIQYQMGLRKGSQKSSTFIYQLFIGFVTVAFSVLILFAFSMDFLVNSSIVADVLMLILFVINIPILTQIITSFSDSASVSAVISLVLVLLYSICGMLMCSSSFSSDVTAQLELSSYWYSLLPGFAPVQQLVYISQIIQQQQNDNLRDSDISFASYSNPTNRQLVGYYFAVSTLLGYLSSLLYYCISLYIEEISKKQFGCSKEPFYFLSSLYQRACCNKQLQRVDSEISTRNAFWTLGQIFIHPKLLAISDKELQIYIDKICQDDKECNNYTVDQYEQAVIQCHKLTKVYKSHNSGKKVAVDGIDLAIYDKQLLSLLGQNGCGKTTTINMITQQINKTDGFIHLDSNDIGVVPQFDLLYKSLTIRQQLQLFCNIKNVNRAIQQEHISELLQALNLSPQIDQQISTLSGGQRRRVSIAIAVIKQPKILIFDELSTGLDVQTKRQLWQFLLKIKKQHCILLTTHDLEEAEILSDRVAIMANGHILTCGDISQVRNTFGSGYKLICKILASKENILEYLRQYQQIHFESMQNDEITFRIDDTMKCSEVFGIAAKLRELQLVQEWGLNRASLESVFCKIVENE